GECYAVSKRPSGRGPGLIVVVLPDGRERSIPRSATAPASASDDQAATTSRHAHISVRTLLPLANHVRAVLGSRHADLEGGGPDLSRRAAEQGGVMRRSTKPVVAACGRDAASTGTAGRSARPASATGGRSIR